MLTSTLDLLMSLSSSINVPLTLLKAPRTVERAMERPANGAEECCGSICHLDVVAPGGIDNRVASPASAAICERTLHMLVFPFLFLIGDSKRFRKRATLTCHPEFVPGGRRASSSGRPPYAGTAAYANPAWAGPTA